MLKNGVEKFKNKKIHLWLVYSNGFLDLYNNEEPGTYCFVYIHNTYKDKLTTLLRYKYIDKFKKNVAYINKLRRKLKCLTAERQKEMK